MRKELHRLDVRVTVDNAAGHRRAGVGLLLRHLAKPRDEVAQQANIGGQPDHQRGGEPFIGGADDEDCAQEINDHVVQNVDQLHHAFADGERGLHQLGGDAAGEFILVEGHRLLEQVAVNLPADAHWIIAHQSLLMDHGTYEDRARQGDQHDECHAGEFPALGLNEGLAVLGR